LTDELTRQFLTSLAKRAIPFSEVPRQFVYERDPKDEPYINLAIAAKANYLVSRDADILDLAGLNNPDGVRLREHAPDLRILDPFLFLADLRRTA
jgi:predicted nucleic acid-binding protein